MKEQLEKFIETEINPMLALHNGSCKLKDVGNGVAVITLLGGCASCPSSHITLYNGIAPMIIDNFPEIQEVNLR